MVKYYANESELFKIKFFYSIKKLLPFLFFFLTISFSNISYAEITDEPLGHNPVKPLTFETIISIVYVNSVVMGDKFIVADDAGNFYITTVDAKSINMSFNVDDQILIQKTPYININNLTGVEVEFDMSNLTLHITLGRERLDVDKQVFNYGKEVDLLDDSFEKGFFINYGFDYTGGDGERFPIFEATNEIGVSLEDGVFLSDAYYVSYPGKSGFYRLNSRFVIDDKLTVTRLTVGDAEAVAGPLGGRKSFAGINFKKNHSMKPYFKKYGLIDFEGFSKGPGTLEIYSDGILMDSRDIKPGLFEIKNYFDAIGSRDIDFVLKDNMGREERYNLKKYISAEILKEGLHDFSYSIGAARENFATDEDKYEDFMVAFSHDYGLKDWFNIRSSGYGKDGVSGIGAGATLLGSKFGILREDFLSSFGNDAGGFANKVSYSFKNPSGINLELFNANYSEDFTNLNSKTLIKSQLGGIVSYGNRQLGTFSYSYSDKVLQDDSYLNISTIRYLKVLFKNFRASISVTDGDENGKPYTETYLSLHYYPKPTTYTNFDKTISDKGTKQDSTVLRMQKGRPQGSGYGYNVVVREIGEEAETVNETTVSKVTTDNKVNKNNFESLFYYNTRHFKSELKYFSESSDKNTTIETYDKVADSTIYSYDKSSADYGSYGVKFAGGFASVGGRSGLVRPVRDSFALVKVGSIEGVKGYVNNIPIGKTDKDGYLWVPELNSYSTNQISISDKNIPIEYHIGNKSKKVTPWYRSGSCVNFTAFKSQFLLGNIFYAKEGREVPLEYVYIKSGEGTNVKTLGQTGIGGEFYIENRTVKNVDDDASNCSQTEVIERLVNPGDKLFAEIDGEQCYFTVDNEPLSDVFMELGNKVCEIQ